MDKERRLWIALAFVMSISFAVLGYYGYQIYQQAPPIPDRIVTPDQQTVFTGEEIKDGTRNLHMEQGKYNRR